MFYLVPYYPCWRDHGGSKSTAGYSRNQMPDGTPVLQGHMLPFWSAVAVPVVHSQLLHCIGQTGLTCTATHNGHLPFLNPARSLSDEVDSAEGAAQAPGLHGYAKPDIAPSPAVALPPRTPALKAELCCRIRSSTACRLRQSALFVTALARTESVEPSPLSLRYMQAAEQARRLSSAQA